MFKSNCVSFIIFSVLVTAIYCNKPSKINSFEPGSLTAESVVRAAEKSGFRVQEIQADILPAVHSNFKFETYDYDDPLLIELRNRYKLAEVVVSGRDEWEKQLLLKEWVSEQITNGNPTVEAHNALEILQHAAEGKKFYCSYFAITYLQCAQALGWQARKIGVDRLHGPDSLTSTHHGVAEIWSNRFAKWVVMDAQSNLHYELSGVPLSSWEIRAEWLKNKGADVDRVVGVPPNHKLKNPAIVWWNREDEDETACYFWIYVSNSVNWNEDGNIQYIFPQDSVNAGLTWYQNDTKTKSGRLHTGYQKGFFRPTERIEDAYWSVGLVETMIDSVHYSGDIFLSFDSYCPNLVGYEYSLDGLSWSPVENAKCLGLKLSNGNNYFAVRTLSKGDVRGEISSIQAKFELN